MIFIVIPSIRLTSIIATGIHLSIITKWKITYFFAVFKMLIVNSWVIYNETRRITMTEYLRSVALWLINQDGI